MTYTVVTSFSAEGYEQYGRKFMAAFAQCWPEKIGLLIYTDGACSFGSPHRRTRRYDLEDQSEWQEFMKAAPEDTSDYRWKAKRFANKVFAITDGPLPKTDWLIWLDADVETLKPIDEDFLKQVCPEGYLASYLGREGWHTSECGWVTYNLNKGGRDFLRRFRNVYTSGEIYSHLEWHDSYIFDRVREEFEARGHKFHNLAEGISGMHPWPETLLGTRMKHNKGPLRKKGKHPEGLPAEYWSKEERA